MAFSVAKFESFDGEMDQFEKMHQISSFGDWQSHPAGAATFSQVNAHSDAPIYFPNGFEYPSQITLSDPEFGSFNGRTDRFDKSFEDGVDGMNSAIKWATAASIVSGLVMAVAIVAIVYAIIDCLKKTGSAIPSYARIARHDIEMGSNRLPSSNENGLTMSLAQVYPVIPDLEIKGATMDRFFGKMARERPIRFSRSQLEECTKGFTAHLGSGSYGVVYKGEFPDGLQVAVKWLKNRGDDQKVQEQFMAEMSTLGRTYHNNLVRLCGFCFDPDMKALVYEFMERGSLNKILFGDDQDTIIKWEKLYEIAIGIAKGIAYLHEECRPTIIHYDIKPGNILLDKDLNPKVADFGLAKLRINPEMSVSMAGFRGTREYAAPEFWNMNVVSHKCDVYSFGIMLFEILGRRRNFDEDAGGTREYLSRWTWEMFEKSELGELFSLLNIDEKNREKAERMAKVALWCIQHLAEARPKMSDVVKMLEGGMEIATPNSPFQHSFSSESGSGSGLGLGFKSNSIEIELVT